MVSRLLTPGMGIQELRRTFRKFLDRLVLGEDCPDEWQELVIIHYHDELLEDVRRECVRIMIHHGSLNSTAKEELAALAKKLQNSID